jgi:tRNA uridine 5-carboxymethylaminomethyl modification enzyme
MFTSRAEYRLLLRHDNADRRLTPLGKRIGLVNEEDWRRYQNKEEQIAELMRLLAAARHDGLSLEKWLRRPETTWADLCDMTPSLAAAGFARDVVEQVELEAKYSGYIQRQAAQVERFQRMEGRPIPATFDYAAIPQLRAEAKEKLGKIRPTNLGQAARVSGISPADLAVLVIYLDEPSRLYSAGADQGDGGV